MVEERFGRLMAKWDSAIDREAQSTDLIAKSEDDFLHWAEHELFKGKFPKTQGSLGIIDNKVVLIVRPRSGIRRAVYVKTEDFLNHVTEFVSVVGSPKV